MSRVKKQKRPEKQDKVIGGKLKKLMKQPSPMRSWETGKEPGLTQPVRSFEWGNGLDYKNWPENHLVVSSSIQEKWECIQGTRTGNVRVPAGRRTCVLLTTDNKAAKSDSHNGVQSDRI
jgi:hypothetical protein